MFIIAGSRITPATWPVELVEQRSSASASLNGIGRVGAATEG